MRRSPSVVGMPESSRSRHRKEKKMEKFGKWIKAIFTTCTYAARTVAEPPNLMPHRSACLPLDTKHSRENTKLLGFVGHTPGETPKIHIFTIRITNERIKLTSFLTISYITLHVHQSITFIIITAECNHLIRVMNNLI